MKLDSARISNDNVAAVMEQGLAAIRAGDLDIDLSAVRECNTAAVAMLLAWQREARARGVSLQITGVPANLTSLAQLYGVEAMVNGG